MKRFNDVSRRFVVVAFCFFPSVSEATNMGSGLGVMTVDIQFESMAPYYQPEVAIVSSGDRVRWSNPTASPHSIRHDGCLTDGPCVFRSIAVRPDESFIIPPLSAGRYPYHCELHPVMRGMLIVIDSPPQSDASLSMVHPSR